MDETGHEPHRQDERIDRRTFVRGATRPSHRGSIGTDGGPAHSSQRKKRAAASGAATAHTSSTTNSPVGND